jgi:alkanesulfonate monooxygenase SsuD/methylene tetrahydromethanopterin reductase-like flavin-dependent oxidoreductase (luciferase family)
MRECLEKLLDQVRLAQAVGFQSIVAPQHRPPAPFQMLHPLPLLARMAAEADKMRLIATILLLSLHNPLALHAPIWMMANGDGAVVRAARLADTWYLNPHPKLETLERQMTLYHHALAKQGKPFPQELPIRRELFVARDRDLALRTCMPYLQRKYRTYVAWGQSEALPQEDSLNLPFDELRDQRFIIGGPDDCVEQLLRHHERLGAKHFLLRVQCAGMPQEQVLEAVELFGERLIPRLRDV